MKRMIEIKKNFKLTNSILFCFALLKTVLYKMFYEINKYMHLSNLDLIRKLL